MEFRILGALEVRTGERLIQVAGRRPRALLAFLLLHRNTPVPAEGLVHAVWHGEALRGGVSAVQVNVSRLRRSLGTGGRSLETTPSGYVLRVAPGSLDADRFAQLHDDAREALAAGEHRHAADLCRHALGLWCGPPLAEFSYEPWAQESIVRLEEMRHACLEMRVDADLGLGLHGLVVGELEGMIAAHPLRERSREQLMLALYRCGRQAEALDLYRMTRELLVSELGLEPGPGLRALEAAILGQNPSLDPPFTAPGPTDRLDAPGSANEWTPPESSTARKTITVLCVAPVPSRPGLDPEVRRELAARRLAELSPVLERHGGLAISLAGDAAIGVFGLPAAHEDDALRALRAAIELRDGVALSDACPAIALDTGEVLADRAASEQPLLVGEVTERVRQLARLTPSGEIALTESTRMLVRGAALVRPSRQLGDKEAGCRTWRLRGLRPEPPPLQPAFETPLIGRKAELLALHAAFERVAAQRRAQLVTLFGEAGIGKTRLAHEFARELDGSATVLGGRCLSYGEGVTFWPLREMILRAGGLGALRTLLGEGPQADAVASRLEAVIGTHVEAIGREEAFWAVRRLIEALAEHTPLVLVFDDIHWAEPTLLELIIHLTATIRDAPVLVLCLARLEILDVRPAWGGGTLDAMSRLLQPLDRGESLALIEQLAPSGLPAEQRERIVEAAAGNPLFVEQMLAMIGEGDAHDGMNVPPAISALLAARLERLAPDERRILERAAIEGETFHVSAVHSLRAAMTADAVRSALESLAGKELVGRTVPSFDGEEAFRFRHALIRDTAYASLTKETRAELHERHADWLGQLGEVQRIDVSEFRGYHLEQACLYRSELRELDPRAVTLADRARGSLLTACRHACRRGDLGAALNLIERARALPSSREAGLLEPTADVSFALFQAGEYDRADALAAEALSAAASDEVGALHVEVVRDYVRLFSRPGEASISDALRRTKSKLARLENGGSDQALTRAWNLIWHLYQCVGRAPALRAAAEQGLKHATQAASRPDELWSLMILGYSLLEGPTPVAEGVQTGRRRLEEASGDPLKEAVVATHLAPFLAMSGAFDEARRMIADSRDVLLEVGLGLMLCCLEAAGGRVESLAGDPAGAERVARFLTERARETGNTWYRVIGLIDLGRALSDQGRLDESVAALDESERLPWQPDIEIVIKRPATRALALARLGEIPDALRLMQEALDRAAGSQYLNYRADVLVVNGEVLRLAGQTREATRALGTAVRLFERKGNRVCAERAAAARASLEVAVTA